MDLRKTRVLALLLACVMFLPVGCSSGSTEQSYFSGDSSLKIYVASGHPEWWPIMYRENDRIIGVGPDLVSLIARDLGLSIDCRYGGTWDRVLQSARDGEIDIVVAAYKTAEREQYMDFS